jgi:muramoyltetrapeptide carboxypeptidase
MKSAILKPRALRRGDVIGLVSPASAPTPPDKIQNAAVYLESLGYRVEVGPHACDSYGYLAGKDKERAGDFNGMIADPRVKAIFATRGGYGSPRLLSLLDYKGLRRNPKIIVGFSDITALQLAVWRKISLVSFSGPMPAVEFCNSPLRFAEESFWRMITSTKPFGRITNEDSHPLFWSGQKAADGPILGGNLSLVIALLGTSYSPDYRGALLALEEVEEAPYRVDRMLTQLRHAGVFKKVAALALGQFTRCENKDKSKPSLTTREVLDELLEAEKLTAAGNLQYGHIPAKLTLPIGIRARIDPLKERIEILERAVS